MITPKLSILTGLAALALTAGSAAASDTLSIGGYNAFACSTSNSPATLADGITLASADMVFDWDGTTNTLWLTVENTSAVSAGIPNPLITEILFNLPSSAVSGISLVSQTGAGGAPSNFAFQSDLDLADGKNALKAGCMGAFGARLDISGISGAIANINADTISAPAGSSVLGPVVFEFAVTGPGLLSMTSSAFSSGFSTTPPGTYQVNATMHFQAGGVAGVSDKVSNSFICAPSGWMVGEPRIGQQVTFTMAAAPGCHGCLAFSPSPGPMAFGNFIIPLGNPMYVLLPGTAPASGKLETTVTIPNDPVLIGMTFYFAVISQSLNDDLEVNEGFTITVTQ